MTDPQKHIETVRMALEEWRNGLRPRDADEVFTALSALEAALPKPETGETRMKPIPIRAARHIADEYGYDQVVIIARAVGTNGAEHCTTYGKTRAHCEIAARIGDYIKHKIMGWPDKPDLTIMTTSAFAMLKGDYKKRIDELTREVARLQAENATLKKPTLFYDANNWEWTHANIAGATDNLCPGDAMEICCLAQLPSKHAACVRDNGRGAIVLIFDTAEEADAAIDEANAKSGVQGS